MNLIIIKFSELLLWFSPRIINALKSNIKHSKECFIRYRDTSKLVKKLRCALFFQPTSLCLYIWWNALPRVRYITWPCYDAILLSIRRQPRKTDVNLFFTVTTNKKKGPFFSSKGKQNTVRYKPPRQFGGGARPYIQEAFMTPWEIHTK